MMSSSEEDLVKRLIRHYVIANGESAFLQNKNLSINGIVVLTIDEERKKLVVNISEETTIVQEERETHEFHNTVDDKVTQKILERYIVSLAKESLKPRHSLKIEGLIVYVVDGSQYHVIRLAHDVKYNTRTDQTSKDEPKAKRIKLEIDQELPAKCVHQTRPTPYSNQYGGDANLYIGIDDSCEKNAYSLDSNAKLNEPSHKMNMLDTHKAEKTVEQKLPLAREQQTRDTAGLSIATKSLSNQQKHPKSANDHHVTPGDHLTSQNETQNVTDQHDAFMTSSNKGSTFRYHEGVPGSSTNMNRGDNDDNNTSRKIGGVTSVCQEFQELADDENSPGSLSTSTLKSNKTNLLLSFDEEYYHSKGLKVWDMPNVLCKLCNNMVGDIKSLELHHGSVHQRLTCFVCTKPYASKQSLKCHIKLHMQPRFECPYCPKRFHRKDHLQKHLENHPNGTCGDKTPNDMPSHDTTRTSNKVNNDIQDEETDKSIATCGFCNIEFENPNSLESHLQANPDHKL